MALVHGRRADPTLDQGVHVERVPVLTELLFTPISPGFRSALGKALSRFQPEVLHVHVPNPSAFWLLTLRAARSIPWVIHWHSDIVASTLAPRLAAAYRLYRPLERRLLGAATRIIATSPPYLESSTALAEVHERCRVVPLGIELGRYVPACEPIARWPGSGSRRVLAVGRLTYYKGFDRLLEAVAGIDASLVIVGAGNDLARLRSLTDELDCAERVRIETDADDRLRNAYLESCDVLCQPSLERTEAFGIVLLEAFAFGKPVVASAIPGSGAPWVVTSTGGGMLATPGDAPSLAASLEELLAAPQRAADLGAAGRAAVESRFDIARVARDIEAVYAEALDAPRRSAA
jgi:rhamnosyl/mannosyltransferase